MPPTESRPSRLRRVVLLFSLALAIRVAIVHSFVLPDYRPVGDAAEYVTIARNVAAGNGFAILGDASGLRPTARRSPLFPLLLSACFALFGAGYQVPFLLVSLAGAVTCVLCSELALRLFGAREAWIAGLVAAVTPSMWINGTTLMTEGLYVLLLTALVWSADRMLGGDSRAWARAGLFAGLLALTRAEGILLWGVLLGWIAIAPSMQHRRRNLVGTFAVAALVVSPWLVRNLVVFRAFIPTSTVTGFVLAGANNRAIYEQLGALGGWTAEFVHDPRYAACRADPRAPEPVYTDCWTRQAVAYAFDNRHLWPYLVEWRLRRALDLWDPQLSAVFEEPEGRLPKLTIAAAISFYPVLALGALGALFSLARFRRLYWLYAIPGFYLLEIALTWGVQRLRAPMEPFLILFASALVARSVGRLLAPRSDDGGESSARAHSKSPRGIASRVDSPTAGGCQGA